MIRAIGNLRTLGVYPCGACRAYVRVVDRCEHTAAPVRIEPKRDRRERPDRFYHPYGLMRLAESTRSLSLLAGAFDAGPEGLALSTRLERQAAGRLLRSGLLTLERRGGPFVITDKGREVLRLIQEMNR